MLEQFEAALSDGDVGRLHELTEAAMQAGLQPHNMVDIDGRSLAHMAVEHGQVPAFMIAFGPLLDQDASAFLDVHNTFGETPLHLAAAKGDAIATRIMLERGADVHRVDHRGNSALHFAALGGDPEVAGLLLAARAPTAVNDDEKTPAEVARERGHGDVAGVIQRAIDASAVAGDAGHGLAGRASEESPPSASTKGPGHWSTLMRAIPERRATPGFATPAGSASVQSTGSMVSMASITKGGGGAAPG